MNRGITDPETRWKRNKVLNLSFTSGVDSKRCLPSPVTIFVSSREFRRGTEHKVIGFTQRNRSIVVTLSYTLGRQLQFYFVSLSGDLICKRNSQCLNVRSRMCVYSQQKSYRLLVSFPNLKVIFLFVKPSLEL